MIVQSSFTAVQFVRDQIINTGEVGQRVYMDAAPQGSTYPLVVMSIISRSEAPTQDSGSAVDTYRIQVDTYAKATTSASSFSIASEIAEAIKVNLSRATYIYDPLDPEYAHTVDGVQEVNYFTDFIPEIEVHRITNDYLIRIK